MNTAMKRSRDNERRTTQIQDELDRIDDEDGMKAVDCGNTDVPQLSLSELFGKFGLSIQPKMTATIDRKTGELREVPDGYVIQRVYQDTGHTFYAGPTLAWTFLRSSGSFATRELATNAAVEWATEQHRNTRPERKYEVVDVAITVPMAVQADMVISNKHVQVYLDPELQAKINCLYAALRQRNVTVQGRPIQSAVDCFRWLLAALKLDAPK